MVLLSPTCWGEEKEFLDQFTALGEEIQRTCIQCELFLISTFG